MNHFLRKSPFFLPLFNLKFYQHKQITQFQLPHINNLSISVNVIFSLLPLSDTVCFFDGMGNSMRRRFAKYEKITPDYLKYFEKEDIDKTFAVLEKYYRLNPDWRKAFKDHFCKTPVGIPEKDEFLRWATDTLNRSLQIIKRDRHNVIFIIAKWVIRDKVLRQEQLERERKNYQANDPKAVSLIKKIVREESQQQVKESIKPWG